MAVTRDSKFLITGGEDKHVKKISITNKQVVKDFGEICSTCIVTIQLVQHDQSLFVYGFKCNLKLIELTGGTTIKDYGRVYDGYAQGYKQILVTRDGESLFTTNIEGSMKQFSVRGGALV